MSVLFLNEKIYFQQKCSLKIYILALLKYITLFFLYLFQ